MVDQSVGEMEKVYRLDAIPNKVSGSRELAVNDQTRLFCRVPDEAPSDAAALRACARLFAEALDAVTGVDAAGARRAGPRWATCARHSRACSRPARA